MDSTIKDQAATTGSTPGSKLRYPLRSATKVKEETLTTTPSSKRGRAASKGCQSVIGLELSAKEKDKSAKPPRRLSNPTKSTVSPSPRSIGTITPIAEARGKRSNASQGKAGTPGSDVSKSLIQRKFNVLASTSYWLMQIKLAESVGKHIISIGFFKLALEAGCEPLQRMRDELKAYALRNNLTEFGDSVNELLKSYSISEDLEQLQVSQTCSHVPEGTQSTEEDVSSCTSSATTKSRKLKPKSLNSESFKSIADSTKEGAKKQIPAKNKVSSNDSHVKPQRVSSRQKANKEKETTEDKENSDNKSADELDPVEDKKQDYKENMAQQMEEISLTEV
ncbi:hypothetical protein C5167_022537 [Papaver somniferum]|uniref:Uncharacterized protein n=1 Tax=Papaver somniferum TaxID=3469 RepID=A0A4Y7JJ33_PAPSO|nr:hypothetical protein C5167_022537 [Papaver somniferum]